MTEYSRMMQGSFTSTGFSQIINLPFQPDYVSFVNLSVMASPAADRVINAVWQSPPMAQGTAAATIYNGGTVMVTDSVVSNGISTFAAGALLQYGPVVKHGGSPVSDFAISTANPAVVTTTGNHGLSSGDVIIFQNLSQTAVTGMAQIAGIPFTVAVLSPTTFNIDWDTSGTNYTAFNTATSTGNVGSYKKVLYPYLYEPGVNNIGFLAFGATTLVTTTTAHNFVAGQEVAFRIPQAYGTVELNSLPNGLIPGSPKYGFVTAVVDAFNFVVNINSVGFTPFNVNQPFTSMIGQTFAQVLAVGDVNTGGWPFIGGDLYPSPQIFTYNGVSAPTINGPAIQGAFINNTSQGFIIGNGTCVTDTSAVLVGAAGNVIAWQAQLHD